jgi:hypothetical protein
MELDVLLQEDERPRYGCPTNIAGNEWHGDALVLGGEPVVDLLGRQVYVSSVHLTWVVDP